MGNKKNTAGSRRGFFSSLLKSKPVEKVKLLTADGKLVEVDKVFYDELTTKQKVANKEIYQWMKNPSKDNH